MQAEDSPNGSFERRRYGRVQAQLRVFIIGGEKCEYTRTRDISEGGMLVQTHILRKPESAVDVEIFMEGQSTSKPLHIMGEIAWVSRPTAKTSTMMGVRFLALHHQTRHRLLRGLEPLTCASTAGMATGAVAADDDGPRHVQKPARDYVQDQVKL